MPEKLTLNPRTPAADARRRSPSLDSTVPSPAMYTASVRPFDGPQSRVHQNRGATADVQEVDAAVPWAAETLSPDLEDAFPHPLERHPTHK